MTSTTRLPWRLWVPGTAKQLPLAIGMILVANVKLSKVRRASGHVLTEHFSAVVDRDCDAYMAALQALADERRAVRATWAKLWRWFFNLVVGGAVIGFMVFLMATCTGVLP